MKVDKYNTTYAFRLGKRLTILEWPANTQGWLTLLASPPERYILMSIV